MPPAFNLSQDQTLQFKPVTVFGLLRDRSLTQRTDEVSGPLASARPFFHYCVRLDTFACRQIPENPSAASRIKRPHLSAGSFLRSIRFALHGAGFNYPAPRSVLRRCIFSRETGLLRTF